jgi:formate dehydrogenase major subunit
VPGLGASFGRGAATNYQQDLARSDCILLMGSNMAEAHPVGFRWPMKAKEKGATLIHVDPRFSRTSALCDLFVGIRAGTDIAFLGGMIRYVIENERWFHDYVLAYTNAATILQEEYRDAEDLGGLFSGFHAETSSYDAADGHWSYAEQPPGTGPKNDMHGQSGADGPAAQGNVDATNEPERDPTLQHPRCVFQLIRKHFARYTPELVAQVCGCRAEDLVRVAELLCANSGRERTAALVYAVGWTQHTTGVQMIRCAGILQLLLGNVGRPGGGVMAMRGHSSIQGSTDVPTLYDLLPGYLPQPKADADHETLDRFVEHEGPSRGYWSNFRKFAVSLLKAWYGEAAQPENDFRYDWLPRLDDDHSMLLTFDRMSRGKMKGYILMGMNPGGGGMNAGLHRAGLRNLDWLVVADWFETESAVFWKSDPNAPPPSEIKTEVFFFAAATAPEKDGTLTNTQRLLQWHNQAVDPPLDCRSDAWFVYNLGKRLKRLYAGSTDPKDQPLLNLTWDYDFEGPHRLPDGSVSRIEGEPDIERVLQEINGYRVREVDPRTGRPRLLPGFSELKDDGSTACGCWIYSGVFPEAGRNRAKERRRRYDPGSVEPEWGFAWPHNRRVLYNRASADPTGRPWSERKKLIWWDEETKRWIGDDEPDFEPDKPPGYRPPQGATGMAAIAGDAPFIFKPDGLGWLYAPGGVKDGPVPTHYEPVESPVGNLLYPRVRSSPVVRVPENPLNPVALGPTTEYPVVATTFRLTEHYLSGPMSRFNSWLNELQPEMFVELSPELAAERGIEHGAWLTIRSPRGRIEARAMVTRRMRPLLVNGRTVHQVALPFHWGFAGETVGGIANDLTSIVLDPNVSIHEAKAFAVEVEAGRAPGPHPEPTKRPVAWPTRDPIPDTPTAAQPEGGFAHGRD